MAKLQLKAGTTSKSVLIFVQDSSATTGIGLSGLVFNTSNLIAYWCQPGVTAPAAITLATLATMTTAYSSGAFLEADATHMKGVYRFDIPNTCLTGATDVVIMLSGAANMVPVLLEIELTASDNQDGVHFGLTSLPNAVPGAAGGLFVAGANAPTSITGTSNSAGLTLAGAGTGAGLSVTGGATGHAVGLVGGATSGDGINITTTSGHGINAAPLGQAKHGLFLTGSSNSLGAACDGARLVGGFTGIGLHCLGGTNSGEGIRAEAITGNGDGISGISFGSGVGFRSNAAAVGFGNTATPPTAAAIATAVWTDTTAGDFTTLTSPGKIIFSQLGGAFTTTSSSVFSTAALANGPTGGTAPTASAIATAVWQDATAGDFTVTSSIGKSLYTAGIVPGGSGGHLISGSNLGTTTFAAFTITGALTVSAGVTITQSTTNGNGIHVTGNGDGNGVLVTGGTTGDGFTINPGPDNHALMINGGSSTGNGIRVQTTNGSAVVFQGGTNGFGLSCLGAGSGKGVEMVGGNTGHGLSIRGGGTSGDAIHLVAAGLAINSPLAPPSGPATDFLTAITQLFYRFFPPGPDGEVIKSKLDNTIKTLDSGGTVVSTQTWADDGTGNESIGPAS